MNIRTIGAILKKELVGYIFNPTIYIVAGVFIAVWEFLFFQNVFLIGEASLQHLFSILPWFLLFFVPAMTMGSVAEEVNKETLEIVLTHPIRDREFIVGKFISVFVFVAFVLLLGSFPIAISLQSFGDLDFGVYIGQYLAGVFLVSALTAFGIGVSSYFKNQIPALLLSVVGGFVFIIIGYDVVTMSIPGILATLCSRFSVLTHFESIARGVLDTRDVWYFLLATVIFLQLGHIQLTVRRAQRFSKKVVRERTVLFVLLGIFVFTIGFDFFPRFRIDLTDGNMYTLSGVTKDILSNLSKDVEIVLYETENLPAQYQPIIRTVKDVLKDYELYGGSRIKISYKNPDVDEVVAKEARENGVLPVQFNMVGNSELQVQQASFGMVVKVLEDEKTIPFIQTATDLEYQITSFISELTKTEKKKVAFLDVSGKTSSKYYTVLAQELKKQFFVDDVSLTVSSSTISSDIDVLVVARPSGVLEKMYEDAIRTVLQEGKSVLFLIDGVEVNPQYMVALPNSTSTDMLLAEYGVTVNQDLVYDLRSNETVQIGGGRVLYYLPYPLYIRALIAEKVLPGSLLKNVTVPWASSLTLHEEVIAEKNMRAMPLIVTSIYGGLMRDSLEIDPQTSFPSHDLGERVVGVLIKSNDSNEQGTSSGRLMVIGDTDFLSDQYVQNNTENIAFGMEAVSFLAQENSLASIKIKQSVSHPLTFSNSSEIQLVRYGNIFGSLLFLVFVGALLIGRRSRMRNTTYEEGKSLQ